MRCAHSLALSLETLLRRPTVGRHLATSFLALLTACDRGLLRSFIRRGCTYRRVSSSAP